MPAKALPRRAISSSPSTWKRPPAPTAAPASKSKDEAASARPESVRVSRRLVTTARASTKAMATAPISDSTKA